MVGPMVDTRNHGISIAACAIEARFILEVAFDQRHAIAGKLLEEPDPVRICRRALVSDERDDRIPLLPQGLHEVTTEAPGRTDQQNALRHMRALSIAKYTFGRHK